MMLLYTDTMTIPLEHPAEFPSRRDFAISTQSLFRNISVPVCPQLRPDDNPIIVDIKRNTSKALFIGSDVDERVRSAFCALAKSWHTLSVRTRTVKRELFVHPVSICGSTFRIVFQIVHVEYRELILPLQINAPTLTFSRTDVVSWRD
jgi:hypothetical protein